MKEPSFSPRSVEDLEGILNHIGQDNPTAAMQFVELLQQKCRRLAQHPLIGVRRDELVPGLRGFSVGNDVIYYTTTKGSVRIE